MIRMSPVQERSRHVDARRTLRAIVFKEKKCRGSFPVVRISADIAVLFGDPPVSPGETFEVVIMSPRAPAVRVRAECVSKGKDGRGETLTIVSISTN